MNSFARPPRLDGAQATRPQFHTFPPQAAALESPMPVRPRRSVLFMPASNARALEKARTLPADALIFDLEDSVAPEQKDSARATMLAAIRGGDYGKREIIIRVNGLDTPWIDGDIAAVAALAPDAVLLTKIATPGDVMRAARHLRDAGAPEKTRIWVMMETPAAILNSDSIARTAADPSSRLSVFVMGVNDLARETRARQTRGRAGMMPWLATCILAARSQGVEILDGVFGDIEDLEGLRSECEQGRDMGFDGKTLIHPRQIEICNEIFAPAADEIAWSRRVIAAFNLPENAGKGALSLDGKMIERLHADIARRTLAIVDALSDTMN